MLCLGFYSLGGTGIAMIAIRSWRDVTIIDHSALFSWLLHRDIKTRMHCQRIDISQGVCRCWNWMATHYDSRCSKSHAHNTCLIAFLVPKDYWAKWHVCSAKYYIHNFYKYLYLFCCALSALFLLFEVTEWWCVIICSDLTDSRIHWQLQ